MNIKDLVFVQPPLSSIQFLGPHLERWAVIDVALSIRDSIVLIIGPPSCMREPFFDAYQKGNADRLYQFLLSENDMILGNYQSTIKQILMDIGREKKPGVLFLCTVCADEIIGSDYEGIIEEVEATLYIPVRRIRRIPICKNQYPPPEQKKYSIYLGPALAVSENPSHRPEKAVNIIGEYTELSQENELLQFLSRSGWKVQNIPHSSCMTGEFAAVRFASHNLVTNSRGLHFAKEIEREYGIPFCFAPSYYGHHRIRETYTKIASFLDIGTIIPVSDPDLSLYNLEQYLQIKKRFAIGSGIPGSPFELARTLIELGLSVTEVYVESISEVDWNYIPWLQDNADGLQVFVLTDPGFVIADRHRGLVDYAIGRDAVFYCSGASEIHLPQEGTLFGYQLLKYILNAIHADRAEQGSVTGVYSR